MPSGTPPTGAGTPKMSVGSRARLAVKPFWFWFMALPRCVDVQMPVCSRSDQSMSEPELTKLKLVTLRVQTPLRSVATKGSALSGTSGMKLVGKTCGDKAGLAVAVCELPVNWEELRP